MQRHGTRVEPAVNHLRYPLHLFSTVRAGDRHFIDKRPMQLNIFRTVRRHLSQLCNTAYRVAMTTLAFPDIQRRTPVTVTADAPVLNIFQPVAEAALANAFRDPVDSVVVTDQVIFYRGHFDKPGVSGIVDQRGSAPPAMRVAMFKYRCVKQQSSFFPNLQGSVYLRLCRKYRPKRFPWSFALWHLPVVQRADRSYGLLGVIFAESGGNVYNTGAVS